MIKAFLILISFLFISYHLIGQNTSGYTIDFTNPESVLNAIFYAAKTRDFTVLKFLCDPLGKGDGDTKQICGLCDLELRMIEKGENDADNAKLDEFIEIFGLGEITGEPSFYEYNNDQFVEIPFKFHHPGGPGRSNEKMELIKRYGNWYLYQF